jgi:hypothetical protein
LEFIYTSDKTLASVLIANEHKPISCSNGQYTFVKNEETLKICESNFDRSKWKTTNVVMF